MKKVLVQNGVREERILSIPPYCAIPEEAGEDGNYLLFAGRLDWQKGLDSLLEAFLFVNGSTKLVVVGEGRSAKQSKTLTQKLALGERVVFKGYAPPKEIRGYQRRCSFLVFPSVWEEPSGTVVAEAMAWGKPVIAFDVGGISEFVKDGVNGFLVSRKDFRTLASRIETLAGDEKLRAKMGEASREIARNELNEACFEARVASLLNGEPEKCFSF
jgi:glycosyltransferase involved in cell wall biosynthesis